MNQSSPKLSLQAFQRPFLALFFALVFSTGVFAQSLTYYHAVTGSYQSEQSAAAQLLLLEQKGMKGVLLFPSKEGEAYRISVFQSLYKEEVEKQVKELQKKGYKKAWVYAQTGAKPAVAAQPAGKTTKPADKPAASPTARVGQQPSLPVPSSPYQPSISSGMVNYLVVGSAKKKEEAEAIQARLVTEGYKTYLLNPEKTAGMYRVAVIRHEDKNAVAAYQAKVKSRFPDAWIMAVKEAAAPEAVGNGTAPKTTTRGMSDEQAAEGMRYHLVIASVKDLSSAVHIRETWAKLGYTAMLLPTGAGISETFRVSVFQAKNKQEVTAMQEAIKEQGFSEPMFVVEAP